MNFVKLNRQLIENNDIVSTSGNRAVLLAWRFLHEFCYDFVFYMRSSLYDV